MSRWFIGLWVVVLLGACADDKLNRLKDKPKQPLFCADGSVAIDDVCPVPTGVITGQICNRDTGAWMPGLTASVDVGGTLLTTTTDSAGRFTLEGLPEGSYYVHFSGDNYENELPAFVVSGQTTTIGTTTCTGPTGQLKGRVCNENNGLWVPDAQVSLNDANGSSTASDSFGRYQLTGVVPGNYTVTISATNYSGSRSAEVFAGEVTDLGPSACIGGDGSVKGRICGGGGHWLSNARVFVDLGGGAIAETTTDAGGNYTLTGVPAGVHTVQVTKGSFSASFSVTVTAANETVLPEPVCIPPTTRMAVVTGDWDSVQEVLGGLGFPVRQRFSNSTTPILVNSGGNVDIVVGTRWGNTDNNFWVTDFLGDSDWMAQYDIIFFNCGLDDSALILGGAAANAALINLQDFVSNGGSVYASDWASEVIRMTFPGRINFHGNDTQTHSARVGVANNAQAAEVLDNSLAASLGSNHVTLNFKLENWVVLDTPASQPNDLRVLVHGNVEYKPVVNGEVTTTHSPLIVQFSQGSGRVLYTSAHNEGQNTQDLAHILNYIVFEL